MTAFALCVVDLHTTTIKAAIKKVGCVRVETTVYILRKGIAHSTCGNQQFFLEGETAKVTYKRHASIGIRCKIKKSKSLQCDKGKCVFVRGHQAIGS